MATDLSKAKRKRTTKKNVVLNQILPSCETILREEKNEDTIADAVVMLSTLTEAAMEVKMLDEEVSNLTVDDAEYEQNEKDAYEFGIKTRKVEGKMQSYVDKEKEFKPQMPMMIPGTQRVKLPKIKIKTFEGDAVGWKTFIEAFDATVHTGIDISNIEKFTYLRGFLSGNALQTIEGMPLTTDNYTKAK